MRKERRDGASERGEEEASGGGREQRSEGEEQERSVLGRAIGREVIFKGVPRGGHWPVYCIQRTKKAQCGPRHCDFSITNTNLLMVCKLCIVMRRVMYCLKGGCYDFMWWKLWTGCIWHGIGA